MSWPTGLDERFFFAWVSMCARLGIDPFDAIRVAFSESDLYPWARNRHGNASGIIQFMPDTLIGLGYVEGHDQFRKLPASEQVRFVERFFQPHAPYMKSDGLCYVVTFLPALVRVAAKSGPDLVLCARDEKELEHWPKHLRKTLVKAYSWNPILDRVKRDGSAGRDGLITVADLEAHLKLRCVGSRYKAITESLRQVMGLQPMLEIPDDAPTVPVIDAEGPPSEPTEVSPRTTRPWGAEIGDDIAQATLDEITKRNS